MFLYPALLVAGGCRLTVKLLDIKSGWWGREWGQGQALAATDNFVMTYLLITDNR